MPQRLSAHRETALLASLRGSRLFSDLPAADLRAVTPLVSMRTLDRDEYLFHEGDPSTGFYLVQKGAINVHRVNPAGKEQVIHVFRTGETFAEATLVTERGYPADARAVESSQVLVIQKQGFIALLSRQPEIALRLLASMSRHLRLLVSQLEDLTLKDVETRLIHWLLRRCPDPASRLPTTVELPGTKRVLAAELGTVGETLSRSLAKLRSQQLIAVKGRTILVNSPAQLSLVRDRNLVV